MKRFTPVLLKLLRKSETDDEKHDEMISSDVFS